MINIKFILFTVDKSEKNETILLTPSPPPLVHLDHFLHHHQHYYLQKHDQKKKNNTYFYWKVSAINPLQPGYAFLYPLKTEKLSVF